MSQALAAASAAADAVRPVALVSAPDAGISAGAGWFAALTAAAREAVPGAQFLAVLDCGDDAGAAQAAIRAGIEAIVFTGPDSVVRRLGDIAAARGCRVLTERPQPAHDLAALFFADNDTLRRHCCDILASLSTI